MTDRGTGRGRGKLILFGEHTVVYGTPAIVAGLPNGASATAVRRSDGSHELRFSPPADQQDREEQDFERARKAYEALLETFDDDGGVEVEIDIDIPSGVGLGSSAAFSAAVARAVGELFAQPDRVEAAVEAAESVFHGNPSGIDQLAALKGGLRFYHRAEERTGPPPTIDAPPVDIGVCRAGGPVSTRQMVERVEAFVDREAELFERIELLVGDTVRAATEALERGDRRRLGRLMDVNHGALASLGVSTEALDRAVHVARNSGARGAKLTGAGGGGCVCAVLPAEGGGEVLDAWRDEGWRPFRVQLGGDEESD